MTGRGIMEPDEHETLEGWVVRVFTFIDDEDYDALLKVVFFDDEQRTAVTLTAEDADEVCDMLRNSIDASAGGMVTSHEDADLTVLIEPDDRVRLTVDGDEGEVSLIVSEDEIDLICDSFEKFVEEL